MGVQIVGWGGGGGRGALIRIGRGVGGDRWLGGTIASNPTQPPTLTRPPIYRDQRYPCYIDVDILSHNIVIDPLLSVTIVL